MSDLSALLIAPTAPSASHSNKVRPLSSVPAGDLVYDVVVIGTGAGGAVFGTACANAGLKVCFLESGGGHTVGDYRKKTLIRATRDLYENNGLQVAIGSPPILVPQGRVVGGSTVLNSAICFRPPDARLDEWATFVGDDRLKPAAMKPFVDEVWSRIGVAPTHEAIGRRHNVLFKNGAEALGLDHAWMDRNAPGCIGCGVCHLGCPSGGKASVDKSILPEAINRGADVFTFARAQAVRIEGGRARRVLVDVLDPQDRRVQAEREIAASAIVVAGSALGTPLVLQNSGVEHQHVGAHLSLHPGTAVLGHFTDPVTMWDGVPQGYYAHHKDQPDVVFETVTVGVPELHMVLGGPGAAGAHRATTYKNLAMAGAMLRDVGEGTVRVTGHSERQIRYNLHDVDVENIKTALKTVVQVYFAAGAEKVAPLVKPLTFFDREADALAAIDDVHEAAHFAQVHASHPHGTARMGPRGEAVCDGDGKVHGVEGLYVGDGSLFPSTLGVNPQVTIMALSLALGTRLAAAMRG